MDLAAQLVLVQREREETKTAFEKQLADINRQREVLIQSYNFQAGALSGREALLKEMLQAPAVTAPAASSE